MAITFSPQLLLKIRRILSLKKSLSCLSTKCSTNNYKKRLEEGEKGDNTGFMAGQRSLFWRLGTLTVNHNRKFREISTRSKQVGSPSQRGPFKVAPGFGLKEMFHAKCKKSIGSACKRNGQKTMNSRCNVVWRLFYVQYTPFMCASILCV